MIRSALAHMALYYNQLDFKKDGIVSQCRPFILLYQLRVSLYGPLDPLGLYAYVSLGGDGAAVLQ